MATISSYNSWALVDYPTNTIVGVVQHEGTELNAKGVLDDITTTGDSWAQNYSKLGRVEPFQVSVLEDDTTALDLLGLPIGARVTLWVRRGDQSPAKFDKIVNCLFNGYVKAIAPKEGKARRLVYEFAGGAFSSNVAGSSAVTTYMGSNSLT